MTIKRKIKKINIFPVSQSPIRSMPPKLIDEIIKYYEKDYKINVIYDNLSTISDYLVKNVNSSNYKKIYPSSLENLCQIIKKTELGIFIDSGPLHLAKIFGIKGVLIITSVGENVLLNQFHNIKEVKNSFYSKYCKSPCGLTNIFNWKNNIGCYESLHVFKKNLIKSNNLNLLQRGSMKKKYIDYMLNPVGCVKHLDSNNIINQINNCINK
jgi:ADP-heptose:LPS heptosyltransferase